MNKRLSDFAQIAEIISAVAIVLSLIFVGFQLRDNAAATRSATANATIASTSAWYLGNGLNEQASTQYYNAIINPDEQTEAGWYQYVLNMHALMLNFQNSFYLVEQGTLDDEIRDSLTAVVSSVKEQPGYHRYWEQRRAIFFPEFQHYIDEILASEQVVPGVYPEVPPAEESQ